MADRPVRSLSDDELLAALGTAMAPETIEPSPAALHDVRLLLAQRHGGALRHRLAGRVTDWRWRLTGWRGRLAVAGATVGVVAVAGGTAFALGAPVPSPVRSLAYDLGLPVTPPAVVQVQNAARAVQSDLVSTSATSPTDTVRDTRALAHALLGLSPGERVSVRWSERVFAQACRAIASHDSTSWASAAPTTPVPACAQSGSPSPTSTGPSGTGVGVPGGAGGAPSGSRNPTPGSRSPASSGGEGPSGHHQAPSGSDPGFGPGSGGPGSQPGSGDSRSGGSGQPGGTTQGMRR